MDWFLYDKDLRRERAKLNGDREKSFWGGGVTSVWAPILLEQFQNSVGFNTEHENKCSFPSHIDSSTITTFRDM